MRDKKYLYPANESQAGVHCNLCFVLNLCPPCSLQHIIFLRELFYGTTAASRICVFSLSLTLLWQKTGRSRNLLTPPPLSSTPRDVVSTFELLLQMKLTSNTINQFILLSISVAQFLYIPYSLSWRPFYITFFVRNTFNTNMAMYALTFKNRASYI